MKLGGLDSKKRPAILKAYMPEKPKQEYPGNKTKNRGQGPPDPNVRAWEVVQQAIGEMPKEEPRKPEPAPERVAIGRMGGKLGGPIRAAKLTPEQRKRIAVKAAETRWGNPTLKKD